MYSIAICRVGPQKPIASNYYSPTHQISIIIIIIIIVK